MGDKLNSISAFTKLQINEAINDCRVLENIHQILKNRLVISKTMITEKSIMISGKKEKVNELRLDIKGEKLSLINSSNNPYSNTSKIFKNDSQCIIEEKEQEIKIEKERQEYDLQVRDWERYEDERCRNSSRYNSIKKKQVNDRKKAIIHDKELVCSDEELSNWQRKLVRFSRKSEMRRYTKIYEKINDDKERLKQIKEIKQSINLVSSGI